MEEMNFGYLSQEEVSKTSKWHFGINQNVFLKEIKFVEETTNDEGVKNGCHIVAAFGHQEDEIDKCKKINIYAPNKDKQQKGDIIYTPEQPEFKDLYNKAMEKVKRTIFDLVECFYEPVQIISILGKSKPATFEAFCKLMVDGVNKKKLEEQPLDLFLQYSSRMFNGRNFLEIPNANMGHYVTKHHEGEWKEDIKEGDHYYFVNIKTKEKHPIARGNFQYWWQNNTKPVSIEQPETSENSNSTTEKKPFEDFDWNA